ncbi:hypothetical protein [Nocardia sp. NPDC004722]
MGLDYSYEVYIHRDRAVSLLEAIADNMKDNGRDDWTIAEIAGGRVTLPCTTRFKSGRTISLDPSSENREFMDLSLRFDTDEALRAYGDPDDEGQFRIGYIYLTVYNAAWLSPDHLEFSFMAATTDMSILFLESPSIRNWFASLAIDHDAPLCLLDVEQGPDLGYAPGYYMSVSVGTGRIFERATGTRQAIFERLSR